MKRKKIRCVGALILCSLLVGCSSTKDSDVIVEESSVVEIPYEELSNDFLDFSVSVYEDEIGVTESGKRIVTQVVSDDIREYSVYEFDDTGYYHKYYLFAYDDYYFEKNQTTRIQDLDILKGSLIVDIENKAVIFSSKYIVMGDNAYNYFRESILQEFEAERVKQESDVPITEIMTNFGEYSVKGNLDEYVKPVEVLTDENGVTLCSNDPSDFSYTKNSDGNLVIVDYDGETLGEKLVIPAEINGVKVQTINKLEPIQGIKTIVVSSGIEELNSSFYNWSDLESLVIENGLKKVSSDFNYGTNIRSIVLPNTVEEIGDYFYKPYDLSKGVELPEAMTVLNKCLAQSNIKSFIVPANIKVIESCAFEGCTELQVVFISEGVETVESDAFLGCTKLQAVSIPASVKKFSRGAIPEDVLWAVVAGSAAEDYAKANNITYGYQ